MSFRLYTSLEEENIHIRGQARLWQRSGLISEDQLQAIQDVTDPHLHQTNLFFRLLFFVFTLLCAGAVIGLLVWMMEGAGDEILAIVLLFLSVACFILAEHLVKTRRFYRYGIEEALLINGMVCFVASFVLFIDGYRLDHHTVSIVVCLLLAVISGLIYSRAGYLYAAFISVIPLGVIPFQMSIPPVVERSLLLLILCGLFAFSLAADKPDIEDFRKDRSAMIQAGLLIAIYLTVNLEITGLAGVLSGAAHSAHLNPKLFPPYLYWLSYVLTFLIPVASIILGIRIRRRLLLNTGLLMACATLATNKSYLGMTRYAWDPIILGTVMVALSLFITRWLNAGPDQRKYGFTATDILKPETSGINLADVAAALTPGAIDAQQPQTQQDQFFKGGSSGGGGTERKF